MLLLVNLEVEMIDALLWNEVGNIHLKIGSPKDAIAAFKKAIELNPEAGWSYCNLGHAYFLTGEYGNALFLFRKSIQLIDTPEKQAIIWNKIGDAYRALKDIDNAIQAYKKADELDMSASLAEKNAPKQTSPHANSPELTRTVIVSPDQKSRPIDLPNKIPPSDPMVKNQVIADGFQPVNLEVPGKEDVLTPAQVSLVPVTYSEPNRKMEQVVSEPAPGVLPTSVSINKEQEDPLLAREKTIVVIPDPTQVVENPAKKGTSTHGLDTTGDGVKVVRTVEVRGAKSKGQSNITPCIDNLEEILAKVNIYEKITGVNPTNDRAWDTLGKLYKSLGRYQDAIGAYQKAIEVAPERDVYYYYLGLLYSVEQLNEDAVQAFQVVLRKNPDYILAHSALAGVYHRMGLENKANHHIATALPRMSNESAYNRACFYAICGEKDLAFEFLQLALRNKDTTIEWIKSDPDLDPIRTDHRYLEFISQKDQFEPDRSNENYFSSELEGKPNRLLPALNHSLAR
jgi:tetratricopeptide (TPR) repeat protein